MDADMLLGKTVVAIQQRNGGPRQVSGSVTGLRGDMLAVTFEALAAWEAGWVMLVTGETGARQVARAEVVQATGAIGVFRLRCGWQAFDPRANPRFPTHIEARVRSARTGAVLPGTVVDISTGGLAVSVATRVGGKDVEVTPRMGVYSATLPCEIRHQEECDGDILLHLKFGELSPQQQAFVRHMVQDAKAALTRPERKAS